MAEITLEFLGRQMERMLSKIGILQGTVDIVRRDVARMADDIGIIKIDIQGLHADIAGIRSDLLSVRGEIAGVRHDMRAGFEQLDARIRPLEEPAD